MSRPILIKFDNSLPNELVVKPLLPTSGFEGGNVDDDISEIKVTGTFTPLVMINDIVLPRESIISMKLSCEDFLPELHLRFYDMSSLITMFSTPGPDNKVIIEILPRFDKIYKKIKLRFYIEDININAAYRTVSLSCKYYCDGLNDSIIEAYGKISTYQFFENMASRLKLGFCANIDGTDDERWIYNNGLSCAGMMDKEKDMCGGGEMVIDSWIDWWNNINLVNIYDRYLGDPDTDITCWVCNNAVVTDPTISDTPVEVRAMLTNDSKKQTSPLYIQKFRILSSNYKNKRMGTDRAVNIYDTNKKLHTSTLIQDGSGVKDSVFKRYYYGGEFNSEDNNGEYLLSPNYKDIFKQKIDNNIIQVTIPQPCLGLMRGSKVDLEWYDDGDIGGVFYVNNESIETDVPFDDDSDDPSQLSIKGTRVLNKKISGQYYIVSTYISYNRRETDMGPTSNMTQTLTLSKKVDTFNYDDIYKKQ